MNRDSQTDASRDGSGQSTKADVAFSLDMSPSTIADEKWFDGNAPGNASDYADVTGPIQRRRYRAYKGPNTP